MEVFWFFTAVSALTALVVFVVGRLMNNWQITKFRAEGHDALAEKWLAERRAWWAFVKRFGRLEENGGG